MGQVNESEQSHRELFHDIGAPLAAIKWLLDVTLKDTVNPLSDSQRRHLECAFEKNERALEVIHRELAKCEELGEDSGL